MHFSPLVLRSDGVGATMARFALPTDVGSCSLKPSSPSIGAHQTAASTEVSVAVALTLLLSREGADAGGELMLRARARLARERKARCCGRVANIAVAEKSIGMSREAEKKMDKMRCASGTEDEGLHCTQQRNATSWMSCFPSLPFHPKNISHARRNKDQIRTSWTKR